MILRRFMHRTKAIAFIVTPVLLSAVVDPMTALRLELRSALQLAGRGSQF
jgi:hypothetical protein